MRNNIFDSTRLFQFLQQQVILSAQPITIAAGAVLGTLLVISLLVARFNPEGVSGLPILYAMVFMLAGFILTSQVFAELHSPHRSYAYLTLPVSTFEKLLASWILSALVYTIAFWVVVFLMYALSCQIAGGTYAPTNLFTASFWNTVGGFLVMQTVFLLGACYFRKNNFLKTLFSLFLVVMVVSLYAVVITYLLFGPNMDKVNASGGMGSGVEDMFSPIVEVFFSYLLGPFMILVSYFRLKERQV